MENFKNELIQFAKWSDKQRFDELEESDNAYEKLVNDYFLYRWVGENSISQPVSNSCECGIPYTQEKQSDISYNIEGDTLFTDVMIYYCPKCGNIEKIEEF
jgi:hypothetical protein